MSKDKELVKELYKLAMNQQKIIAKLAQELGLKSDSPEAGGASAAWDDVDNSVNLELKNAAKALGSDPSKYYVNPSDGAHVYNGKSPAKGELTGKVVFFLNDPKGDAVKELFKKNVMGKSLKTDDGKNSEVVAKINLLWETQG